MSKQFSERTVLLDAHAIIHRAYHAMANADLRKRDGTPTGGLYGVCIMLLKIIEELEPDHVVACYDLPKPTFRHAAYEDYKGTRTESEEALKEQLGTSRKIFEAFSIPMYEMEGYEADDILGTLAEQIKQDPQHQVIIASGDMDTLQLVDGDQVQVYTPKKSINDTIMYNETAVVERYGFPSNRIPDYKGLAGDSSDNIKGIAGIGAKTATTLVSSFGTIENIVQAVEEDEQAVIDKGVTKRMVGLVRDNAEDALFSKELATIKCDVPVTYQAPKQSFRDGIDLARAGELFRELEFRNMMTRLRKVLGAEEDEQALLLADESKIDERELAQAKLGVYLLNPVVSDPSIDDILRYGEDFALAYQAIEEDIREQGLDFVYREIECATIDAVRAMNHTGFTVDKTKLTQLSKDFHRRIDTLEQDMYQIAGEQFNIKSTQQLSRILFEVLALPTKGLKKTPKGVISTKESELVKLQGEHAIIEMILEYRELSKLTSTYLDNILPMIANDGRLYSTFVPTGTTTGRMSSRDPNLQNIPTGGQYGTEIRSMFVPQEGYTLLSADYSQIELRMAAELSGDEKLISYFTEGRDIHSAVALEMFGEETPDNRRKAKVINFGILYGMGANALRINLGAEEHSLQDARDYLDAYFERFPTLAGYLESSKQFARDHGYTETLFKRRRYFGDINSKIPFIRAAAERMAINAPIQGTATADIIKLALRDVWDYITTNNLENEIRIIAQVHDELLFEIKSDVVDAHQQHIVSLMESVLEKYGKAIGHQPRVPLVVGAHTGGNWSEVK